MPNYDGGHYFLTTLSPVKISKQPGEGAPDAQTDEPRESYVSRLHTALGKLPTAQQSPATIAIADGRPEVISPFAKTSRTHLSRFVVIDEATFNGRNGANALLASLGIEPQPTDPQHVDQLPCPYLMMAVDFDAILKPGDPLRSDLGEAEQAAVLDSYLTELWHTSSAEMIEIYENCQGFDDVKTAKDFVTYIKRCQIETWMPFNDYYIEPLAVKELPVRLFGAVIVPPLAAFVLALLAWVFGMETWMGYSAGSATVVALLLTVAAIYGVYRYVMAAGLKPWPAAKYGDVASVLKALYTQQKFADFAIGAQGASPEELHKSFGAFLTEHQPSNVLDKTQPPGVIKS